MLLVLFDKLNLKMEILLLNLPRWSFKIYIFFKLNGSTTHTNGDSICFCKFLLMQLHIRKLTCFHKFITQEVDGHLMCCAVFPTLQTVCFSLWVDLLETIVLWQGLEARCKVLFFYLVVCFQEQVSTIFSLCLI